MTVTLVTEVPVTPPGSVALAVSLARRRSPAQRQCTVTVTGPGITRRSEPLRGIGRLPARATAAGRRAVHRGTEAFDPFAPVESSLVAKVT